MQVRTITVRFSAIDIGNREYKLRGTNIVIVVKRPHPEKEIEIEGVPEFETEDGQTVLALGHDNYEIIEKDNTRTQVVKINDM